MVEAHIGAKLRTDEIGGPLLDIPDKCEEFFKNSMRSFTEIKGFKREQVPEYPLEALREGVVNALVHRDYQEGARVSMKLLEDRIVIQSPGALVRPLSLAKVRSYNAPPYSRNPRIAEAFSVLGFMEQRGWGLARMRNLLIEHGLREPEFSIDSGYFVVTYHGYERAVGDVDQVTEFTPASRMQLEFLRREKSVTRSRFEKEFQLSERTARRLLNRLVQLDLLEKEGKGKATRYLFRSG